jgi:transcriptional regulator with XRE-family HTH domain
MALTITITLTEAFSPGHPPRRKIMALTEYGKLVRKLRIEIEKSTKNMADTLGVTPAYLSALETGKKNVPSSFLDKVADYFTAAGITKNLIEDLKEAAFKSQITFEIAPERKDRELVAAFARKFPNMADEQKKQLLEILKDFKS